MAGEFGAFINEKRKGRGPGGQDIMLKDIATALGVTPTYLSDIVKGRRNPPDIEILNKLAVILQGRARIHVRPGRTGTEGSCT